MSKKRMREYGLSVGWLPAGTLNSISDVPGVSVGHVTLNSDSPGCSVRTGVTAILPHQGDWFRSKAAAASYVINGYGKTAGLVQVDELGFLESPVMLTNTFSVPAVAEGTLRYMMNENHEIGDQTSSLNVVTGECNDKHLNDMRGLHVRPEHAEEAIRLARQAAGQPVAEGAVGAGTGMVCFGWKGGIGTSSRKIYAEGHPYHIGVLVLTNFGNPDDLLLLGQPIGERLLHRSTERQQDDGSIMIVVATDLPLDARQLKKIAKRAGIGLARTGSIAHHGSGDVVIAFSNGNLIPHSPDKDILTMNVIREDGEVISQCFRAVAEATEEAIGNSMFMAETTHGQYGRTVRALPVEEVIAFLR
ncbi:DmpA family aminopeptidase [Paenibacillus spongiae]|uniref:P1 family peptidase n=1 Tax=Paenibacillus spongiae TaxID=2909671 RepID=A0ABY5SH33_9BACL|nr:P1 family peptidase [Paenibacillus spongiae]UVI33079.1 P1 family peptidase [Paenibacillus spongiae]